MATYNGAPFLQKQLDSILWQSVPPSELVIVDDGSTDDTIKLAESFAATAPFDVRIYHNKERLGYRRNFMKAARLCRSEIISFCDQDDVWSVNKLSNVLNVFSRSDALLVYHNAKLIDGKGKASGTIFKPEKKSNIIYPRLSIEPWRIVPGFSQSFRRELLQYSALHRRSADMFEKSEHMPHDQWFLFLASALGEVVFLPSTLAHYRQHDNNTSGWLRAKPIAYALHSIVHASRYVQISSTAIRNRIHLLSRLKKRSQSADKPLLEEAIEHYRDIDSRIRQRLKLYNAKSIGVRLRVLVDLIRSRSYTTPGMKFDQGTIWLDSSIGLLLGQRLPKSPLPSSGKKAPVRAKMTTQNGGIPPRAQPVKKQTAKSKGRQFLAV